MPRDLIYLLRSVVADFIFYTSIEIKIIFMNIFSILDRKAKLKCLHSKKKSTSSACILLVSFPLALRELDYHTIFFVCFFPLSKSKNRKFNQKGYCTFKIYYLSLYIVHRRYFKVFQLVNPHPKCY